MLINGLQQLESEVYLFLLLVLRTPSGAPVCNYRLDLIVITHLKRQIPHPPFLSPPTKTQESAKLRFSQLSCRDRLASSSLFANLLSQLDFLQGGKTVKEEGMKGAVIAAFWDGCSSAVSLYHLCLF